MIYKNAIACAAVLGSAAAFQPAAPINGAKSVSSLKMSLEQYKDELKATAEAIAAPGNIF